MGVFRLHMRNANENIDRFAYCIKNNVAAIGWNSNHPFEERLKYELEVKNDFESYYEKIRSVYSGKGITSVRRLKETVPGDIIWIRGKGKYYLGRVSEQSEFIYNPSEEAYKNDSCHQLTNIKWYCFAQGDESTVPGAVSTSFIKGTTFQHINKSYVLEYSQLLYNELSGENYYNVKPILSQESFYSLLTPSDCEDLLCIWLYSEKGYICVPSTNKISTPLYECVLKNPQKKENIYIQVKQGNKKIDAADYEELDGEVWLFTTTAGNIFNYKNQKNINIASPKELYEFALSEKSDNILPEGIIQWIKMLK